MQLVSQEHRSPPNRPYLLLFSDPALRPDFLQPSLVTRPEWTGAFAVQFYPMRVTPRVGMAGGLKHVLFYMARLHPNLQFWLVPVVFSS